MTKKHFIALADMIRIHNSGATDNGWQPFTKVQLIALSNFCQDQNPQFNAQRWMSYIAGECGPNGGKR